MKGARSHIACERWEQTYTCTLMFNNLIATIMKKYILVYEPIDPNESPGIVRQFDTREEAEAFGRKTMIKLWVYEMSM